MSRPRIAFVCFGNACRSQMAEGFAKALSGGAVEAWSAGSRPAGWVHELAIELMKEKGIDISSHRSKGLAELPPGEWDLVVAMGCGDDCPTLKAKRRMEWRVTDPVAMPREEFRKVRDELEGRVRALLAELS